MVFSNTKKGQMVSVYPIRALGNDWEHLIIKRATVSYNWQCVTGGVKTPEKPIDGAYRELFEETGYKASQMIPYTYSEDFLVDDESSGNHDPDLLAKILREVDIIVFIAIITDSKDPFLSPKEHTDWKWCSFNQTYQLVDWAVEKKGHRIIRDFILQPNFPEKFLK